MEKFYGELIRCITVKTRIKEPPFFGIRSAKVLKLGHLTGHFAQV